jgi:hypothetical protein
MKKVRHHRVGLPPVLRHLQPLTFSSHAHDFDVHTIHVFDEEDEAAGVAMVFETPAGSLTVRLSRPLAGQLGHGLSVLVAEDVA